MYGGDVYNQNASAAGVTYNCGGEIPTPLPAGSPASLHAGFANCPTDLSCPLLVSREQIAGRRSCFVPGTSSSAASAATASCTRNARNRVRPGSPTLLFCFPFSPPRPVRVFPARPLCEPTLTVPSPIAPPQSSNSRRDERYHESRTCAGLRRERSRRVCKRTNEAFALSKNVLNAQQVFRLIYVAEGTNRARSLPHSLLTKSSVNISRRVTTRAQMALPSSFHLCAQDTHWKNSDIPSDVVSEKNTASLCSQLGQRTSLDLGSVGSVRTS